MGGAPVCSTCGDPWEAHWATWDPRDALTFPKGCNGTPGHTCICTGWTPPATPTPTPTAKPWYQRLIPSSSDAASIGAGLWMGVALVRDITGEAPERVMVALLWGIFVLLVGILWKD